MYTLIFYKMESGRWKWKLSCNKRILARADYHYASRAAAKNAFTNMMRAVRFGYNTETE